MADSVSQDEIDRVVLFSALTDATNMLFREKLGRQLSDVPNGLDWRNSMIWGYLPAARRGLPLEDVQSMLASPDEPCSVVLEIPRDRLRRTISDFLTHLIQAAESQGVLGASGSHSQMTEAIREVSEAVARMWTRAYV